MRLTGHPQGSPRVYAQAVEESASRRSPVGGAAIQAAAAPGWQQGYGSRAKQRTQPQPYVPDIDFPSTNSLIAYGFSFPRSPRFGTGSGCWTTAGSAPMRERLLVLRCRGPCPRFPGAGHSYGPQMQPSLELAFDAFEKHPSRCVRLQGARPQATLLRVTPAFPDWPGRARR